MSDAHPAVDGVLQGLELSHPEEDEVGGHLRGGLEDHPLLAALEHLLGFDVGVGDRRQAAADLHLDVEGRLAAGVIDAGEGPAGVAFLELGHGDVAGAAAVGVFAAVETRHAVVDPAGVVDAQENLTRHRLRKLDAEFLRRGIHAEGTGGQALAPLDRAAPDGELDGVQNHLAGGLRQIQSYLDMALEGEAAEIGNQAQAVVQGRGFGHCFLLSEGLFYIGCKSC